MLEQFVPFKPRQDSLSEQIIRGKCTDAGQEGPRPTDVGRPSRAFEPWLVERLHSVSFLSRPEARPEDSGNPRKSPGRFSTKTQTVTKRRYVRVTSDTGEIAQMYIPLSPGWLQGHPINSSVSAIAQSDKYGFRCKTLATNLPRRSSVGSNLAGCCGCLDRYKNKYVEMVCVGT